MIIKNPTKNDIEVTIFGVPYKIEAESSLENVPEAHARYWQEFLHSFLILRKDKEVLTEEPVIPQPETAAVETVEVAEDAASLGEEVPEPVIEEVEKPSTAKKGKK